MKSVENNECIQISHLPSKDVHETVPSHLSNLYYWTNLKIGLRKERKHSQNECMGSQLEEMC